MQNPQIVLVANQYINGPCQFMGQEANCCMYSLFMHFCDTEQKKGLFTVYVGVELKM